MRFLVIRPPTRTHNHCKSSVAVEICRMRFSMKKKHVRRHAHAIQFILQLSQFFFSDLVVYWIVYVQKAPLSSAALVLWISLFFPIYAHCWYEHFGTDSITYSIFQSESSCCRTVLLYDCVMWQHRKFMGNRLRLLPIRTCVPFNRCDWLNLLLNRRRWVLHAVTKYL